jgi:three-Cys-motif partner protein
VTPAPPPSLDAALHPVLAAFAGAWARDAARVMARDEEDEGPRRMVYLDAFAGAEYVFGVGDPGRQGPSRAVAAVRAVLEAAPEHARAVLVEEDPGLLARLRAELEAAGWGGRIRDTDDPSRLGPGEVALVEADFRNVADVLLAFAEPTRALLWMAPPSARRLPWPLLEAVLGDAGTDLLLRFPHTDYEKQGKFSGPLADLPPFAKRIVEGCSALLGDARHEWVFAWRAAEREGAAGRALEGVVERFRARLEKAAEGRVLKSARVAPGEDASAAHLFLVASEPAAALALNAAVQGAGLADRAAAVLLPPSTEPPAPPPALDLFGAADAAAEPARRPDPAAAAVLLAERHRGQSLPLRDVLAGLTNSDLTPDEVRGALAVLRKEGRAIYRSLAHPDAVVIFPEEPVIREPRRRRRSEEPDLFE